MAGDVNLLNTGLAAAALTAASRLLEALIKKSAFFKSREDQHGVPGRVTRIESTIKKMKEEAAYDDVLYRLGKLEVQARRHGWEVTASRQIGESSD